MAKLTEEALETAKELQAYYESEIGGSLDSLLSFADHAKDLIDYIISINE